MALKFANNARSTLASSAAPTTTSIILAPGTGNRFPTLAAGDYFVATIYQLSGDHEIVRVVSRAADTLTVVRGQENTIPLAFDAGSFIANLPTAGQMATFFNVDNDGNGSGLDADLLRGEAPANTNTPNTVVRRDASGNFAAGTITASILGSVSGNAGSATVLQNTRTINGVDFNGSANITITANTPNSLTVGNGLTGSPFNGGAPQTVSLGTPITLTADTANVVTAGGHSHEISLPLEREYISPGVEVISGSTRTLNHGLGTAPKLIQLYLRNLVADAGYNPGDIVPASVEYEGDAARGVGVILRASQIIIRVGATAGAFGVINPITGNSAAIINNRWEYLVRAWA